MSLNGRVLFITGGSRGIGLEIGKRAAKDGEIGRASCRERG